MGVSLRTRLGQNSGIGKRPIEGRKEPDSYIPHPASSSYLVNSLSPATSISNLKAAQHNNKFFSSDYLEEIVPEIIVRTDDMEVIDMDTSESVATPQEPVGYVHHAIRYCHHMTCMLALVVKTSQSMLSCALKPDAAIVYWQLTHVDLI